MSVVLFLMKKRVLLFSVVGNGMVGGDFGYFPRLVVGPMKERVLFVLFRIFRFEFVRRFVIGVVQDAVGAGVGTARGGSGRRPTRIPVRVGLGVGLGARRSRRRGRRRSARALSRERGRRRRLLHDELHLRTRH